MLCGQYENGVSYSNLYTKVTQSIWSRAEEFHPHPVALAHSLLQGPHAVPHLTQSMFQSHSTPFPVQILQVLGRLGCTGLAPLRQSSSGFPALAKVQALSNSYCSQSCLRPVCRVGTAENNEANSKRGDIWTCRCPWSHRISQLSQQCFKWRDRIRECISLMCLYHHE